MSTDDPWYVVARGGSWRKGYHLREGRVFVYPMRMDHRIKQVTKDPLVEMHDKGFRPKG